VQRGKLVGPVFGLLGLVLMAPGLSARAVTVRADQAPTFQVGAAEEDITPPSDMLAGFVAAKDFYLGGYGLGSPQGPTGRNGLPSAADRWARGVMDEPLGHPFIRVVVISSLNPDGHGGTHRRTIAFADLDNRAPSRPTPTTSATRRRRPGPGASTPFGRR
jgi:hypothetical protein